MKVLQAAASIVCGGISVEELIASISAKKGVMDYVREVMMGPEFALQPHSESVEFTVLSPRDLGFADAPRIDQFLTAEFCAGWSTQNLSGQAIELCSPEDGPQLYLQWDSQPAGQCLFMAMAPITRPDPSCFPRPEGCPSIFRVDRRIQEQLLISECVSPDGKPTLNQRFAFRHRKL